MSDLEQTLEAKPRDLGGFTVGRVLPQIGRPMVGPIKPGAINWMSAGHGITLRADRKGRDQARSRGLGGEPLDGPRYIWWNFVSSSQDRIHEAAAKWRAQQFPKVFDDEIEFTPAPADGPKFVLPPSET